MKPVRIGCSGWSYRSWRDGLYRDVPARRWLERYAEVFDTVEVNATFYRLPKPETVAAWVEETPEGFVFAVKGSRYLTHMRRLRDIEGGVARFWEPLEPLREAGRLGPVLWQLPENLPRDDDLLAAALDVLPPARHCFEFRHPSWFAAAVRRLLEERGASLAIGDDARRPLPAARPLGGLAYLRLHYGGRGRDGNYSSAELDRWRRRIAAWRSRREVYVYLNNDWRGFAPANARELRRGLSGISAGFAQDTKG
ncbi:MAG: DUF72 domain-containing protein [Solirubrobacterales bacterium]